MVEMSAAIGTGDTIGASRLHREWTIGEYGLIVLRTARITEIWISQSDWSYL